MESTPALAGIDPQEENSSRFFIAGYKKFQIVPENFKLIVTRGGLKGYEFHSSVIRSFMKILAINNIFVSTICHDLLN